MRALLAAAAVAASGAEAAIAPPCDMTLPERHGLLNGSQELCEAYCNYSCGFYNTSAGDTGLPQTVKMYRLTPHNVSGILNKNTGDPLGDIGFKISQMDSPGCDRAGTSKILCDVDLYGEFTVEVTGQWGPYQECNPYYRWDTRRWACDQQCTKPPDCAGRHVNLSRGLLGTTCWCDSTRRHAKDTGRITHASARSGSSGPTGWPAQCVYAYQPIVTGCIHGPGGYREVRGWDEASALALACETCYADENCTGWGLNPEGGGLAATLYNDGRHADPNVTCPSAVKQAGADTIFPPWNHLSMIGGWWYSTTPEGQCPDGAAVGDGGCSWRLASPAKYRNASCVSARVDAVVERNLWAACFSGCAPDPLKQSPCYMDCYRDSLLGDPALNATPASVDEMVAAWHAAFDSTDPAAGGCPDVIPDSA